MSEQHGSAPLPPAPSSAPPSVVDFDGDHEMGSGESSSDEGAMEGVEQSTVETILIKTGKLDEVQHKLVMGMNSEHYPSTVKSRDDNDHDQDLISTAAFFTLRGKDHPSTILPSAVDQGHKAKTLVMAGDLYAGIHMETSTELAKYRDDLADGAAAKKAAAPEGSSAPATTTTGEIPPPAPFEPPAEEVAKAYFHLDTQTPNIELVTYDPKTDNTMSCRLWPKDLAQADRRVAFKVAKYLPDEAVDRTKPTDQLEHAGLRTLETMSQSFTQTCVIQVTIELAEAKERYWTGITRSDLATIRARNDASVDREQNATWDAAKDANKDADADSEKMDVDEVRFPDEQQELDAKNAQKALDEQKAVDAKKALDEENSQLFTRDNLVRILDNETTIKLFFTCKSNQGQVKQWEDKFAKYTRDLLSLCAEYGNFWFYDYQAIVQGVDIRTPQLAKIDWIVPRWLVTEWAFTKTTKPTGAVAISNPRPEKWSPLEFPVDGYPNHHEAAFLLKLGVRDEQRRQTRDLKRLVQSDGSTWFKGRFRSIGKKGWFAVEVYLGLENEMADAAIQLPQPGTRIRFEVDRDTTQKPSKKNSVSFDGVVVYDGLETSASFICVVNTQGKSLVVNDSSSEYNMFISYIVDDTSHVRMNQGIALLQIAADKEDAEGTLFGPDSRSVILGCRVAASNTDILKTEYTEATVETFKAAINRIEPASNKSQRTAAIGTCFSDSGNVVIVGPPGTGKTDTLEKIIYGHGSQGKRCMSVAPMNSNVHTLVDEFLSINAQLPAEDQFKDNEWVYVTGGYTAVDKATRLREDQLVNEAELSEANNALVTYLNDAKNRAHVPHYERTLGYKVGKQIEVWAGDDKYDTDEVKLYTDAKSYLDTKAELRFYEDDDQRKHAKTHIRALEYNLTVKFLQRVKFLFCTLSTAGHPLVQESGNWDVLIIDEAARESRAGIAVPLGTMYGRVKAIVWAGDHKQGVAIIGGTDSNVGYSILSRNVFQGLTESNKNKDVASPCEVTLLDTCYRMEQSLIDWSSRHLYDNRITSDVSAGRKNMPLRNMLHFYWEERLPEDFRGSYTQIGLDVTSEGFESEFMTGTTTRLNRQEAHQIACTVLQMLKMKLPVAQGKTPDAKAKAKVTDGNEPTTVDGLTYRRIVAKDICIIANFTGQVLEIRKAMKALAEKLEFDQKDLNDLWYRTTADVQGKERDIIMYSTVLANGTTRLAKNDKLPIGFVADVHNLNVSLTRCRVARYTFGALRLFVQARRDGHPMTKTKHNAGFFDYIEDMNTLNCIVAYQDSERWFRDGTKPSNSGNFVKGIRDVATFTQKPAELLPSISSGTGSRRNKLKTTAKNTHQEAPSGVTFAGDREGGILKNKRKHRGGKGGNKDKRKDQDDEQPKNRGYGNESGKGMNQKW